VKRKQYATNLKISISNVKDSANKSKNSNKISLSDVKEDEKPKKNRIKESNDFLQDYEHGNYFIKYENRT